MIFAIFVWRISRVAVTHYFKLRSFLRLSRTMPMLTAEGTEKEWILFLFELHQTQIEIMS